MIFHIIDDPVSLCGNIMAERQGKEMEKGMRKEGKNGKSRRKELEEEKWKEKGKWNEKTIHVRFLSYQIFQEVNYNGNLGYCSEVISL